MGSGFDIAQLLQSANQPKVIDVINCFADLCSATASKPYGNRPFGKM
jgi:hypothetical protein